MRGHSEPGALDQALAALGDQQIGLGQHAVWNSTAWMRCCQAVRWSTRALDSRTWVRASSTCAGGIHDSGSRPP